VRTLIKLGVFFWVFLVSAVVPLGGVFAQGDLDEDGIPDAEDPETIVTTSEELQAGEHTFLNLVITNGSVLTLKSDPALPEFKGVKINAENVTIDSTSVISADGKGYGTGSGPGTGAGSGYQAGGAGYGGKGGKSATGVAGGPTYGSATEPVDLGSGGGRDGFGNPGGVGGGAIRLVVSGILTNDGIVSANGTDSPGAGGGGSGGSIYVTTKVLSGSGSFAANGGNVPSNSGGGGGGRIAIYYETSGFTGTAQANGGTGGNSGEEGTVGFFDTTNNAMYVYNTWRFLENDGPAFNFNEVTLENATSVFEQNTTLSAAKLTLTSSFIVTRPQWKVELAVGDLTIDSTSSISADGKGYGTGSGPGTGSGSGFQAGGAGYGGKGGRSATGVAGGPTYGSATEPVDLGSGGGRDGFGNPGGVGGGAIRLVVSGTLRNDGVVSANGTDSPGAGGGGSGGSIYVTTKVLSGSGTFAANGGNVPSNSGGGGGGRIAIYYETSAFTGTAQANGGTGGNSGEDGTVGFFDALNNNFYAGHFWRFQQNDGPVNFNEIVLSNGSSTVCEDDLQMIASTLSIDGSSILFILGTKTVIEADRVSVTANSAIIGNLYLIAENIAIDSTAYISADGKGYGSASGPGTTTGAGSEAGGAGYGGTGGKSRSCPGGPTYGSAVHPTDLGSGGGMSGFGSPGGAGGGAIRLVVSGTLKHDGVISANGQAPPDAGGGGSRGSIYVTTNVLSGSGSFTASGGNAKTQSGGGEGGRIAIYYQTSDFTGQVEAKGGTGYSSGEDATPRLSSDIPNSLTQLGEISSSESTSVEDILARKAAISDAKVEGDLQGTLNFTVLEMVSITTGSFAEKGFTTGNWNATLQGLPYQGEWKGMFFLRPAERRIYLKGTTSGQITGIIEGSLAESTVASGVYDQLEATWKTARIEEDFVSATLSATGTVSYQESFEYPATQLEVLQSFAEGTSVGDYAGPLNTTLTHLRINDQGNPYNGQGFSVLSYTSDFGSGEGWTYDELDASGSLKLLGLLSSPVSGIFSGSLRSTAQGRTLSVTVERTVFGLPPMPDLEVVTWGSRYVSPGQTIGYGIEYTNDGIQDAQDVVVIDSLPSVVRYLGSSARGVYNPQFHEVIWKIGTVRPKTRGRLTVSVQVVWGLPGHFVFQNRVAIYTGSDELDAYLHPETTPQGVAEHLANLSIPGASLAGEKSVPLQGPKFDVRQDACVMKNIQDAVALLQHKRPNIATKFNQLLNNGQVWIDHSRDSRPQDKFRAEWDGWRLYFGKDPDVTGYKDFCPRTFDQMPDGEERVAYLAGTILHETTHSNQPWWWRRWAKEWWAHSEEVRFYVDVAFQEIPKCRNDFGAAMLGLGRNVINDFVTNYGANTWMSRVDNKLAGEIAQLKAGQKPQPNVLPPEKPPADNEASHENEVIVGHDPNIKYGPEGNVAAGQKLDYRVEFENEGEGIAFGVYFIDTLDEDLDDSTLQIGPVLSTADGSEVAPPGTYDPRTRTVTWIVGEVGPQEGGYANLSVNVRGDAPEGTEIINYGIVYFPSVPEVTRTNAIVSVVPYSKGAVKALSRVGEQLTVQWEPFGDGQYTLQTTGDLTSGVWTDVPGEWPTAATWHVMDVSGTGPMFLRVKAAGL